MLRVATDVTHTGRVVCVSVWWAQVTCGKVAEPIEMPFGMQIYVDASNCVLGGVQIPHGGALLRKLMIFCAHYELEFRPWLATDVDFLTNWLHGSNVAFCQITLDTCYYSYYKLCYLLAMC